MRLKFEHAPHRILKTISPVPKVYVDIIENETDNKVLKGIPKKIKENIFKAEMYEQCVLESKEGPEVSYRQFQRVPHIHQTVTVNVQKKSFRFFNPKVFIPDNYDPSQGDYHTLPLGHKDIRQEDLISLNELRKNRKLSNKKRDDEGN